MMRVSKKIRGFTVISWGCLVAILILYGIQTRTFNKVMWGFSIVIPLLLYIPLLLPTNNRGTILYKKIMLLVSMIFFGLALVAAAMNFNYISFVRWGILTLSIVAMVLNVVIYNGIK